MDTEVDRRLEKIGTPQALDLLGQAGLANARLAYQAHEEIVRSQRWYALQAAGANVQRMLGTSTSTKNPAYPDTLYVSGLVVPGTVNTLPPQTLDAVADHGDIQPDTVRDTYGQSARVLSALSELGIDYDEVVQLLEEQGVGAFEKTWSSLLESVESSLTRLRGTAATR